MSGISGVREIAARQLVLPLRSSLDPHQSMRNRIVDRLIVTQLEMQKGVMLDCTPISAVEGVGADEMDRARNPSPGAARHNQQNAIAHFLAHNGKKLTGQIGAAPFP